MNKKFKIITLLLLTFMAIPVFAEANCGAFKEYFRKGYTLIMAAGPILVLVMGSVDFLKATTASDEKAMKKAVSDLVKRIIICLVLLILPLLINIVIGWTTFNNLSACL